MLHILASPVPSLSFSLAYFSRTFARFLHCPTKTRWERRAARHTRKIWQTPPPNIPKDWECTHRMLQMKRLLKVKPIHPVWQSRRIPIMGYKVGSMSIWDEWGERHFITVVHVDRLHVLEKQFIAKHGQEGLRLGLGIRSPVRASNSVTGEAIKLGLPVKDKIRAFRCSSDCLLPVKHELSVNHFLPGQWVMVGGMTRPRGFQGVVRRWNYQGQNATHGTPGHVQRRAGSTGPSGPKMIRRGTKMPQHMGPDPRSVLCKVFRTETFRNLIFLKGMTPGAPGNILTLWDARGSAWVRNRKLDIPWPTFIPKVGVKYPTLTQCPPPPLDPFLYTERPIYRDGRATIN